MKNIHGYIAKVGRKDMKAFTFKYFKSKRDAVKWAKASVKSLGKMKIHQHYRVEPKVFNICECGNFKELNERECLRCDKIRGDMWGDK